MIPMLAIETATVSEAQDGSTAFRAKRETSSAGATA